MRVPDMRVKKHYLLVSTRVKGKIHCFNIYAFVNNKIEF